MILHFEPWTTLFKIIRIIHKCHKKIFKIYFYKRHYFYEKTTLVPHQENVPTYLLCNYETCYALNEQNSSIEPVHDNE